jgi:hypothetical protein
VKGRREPVVRGPDLRAAMDVVTESYLGFLRCGPEPGTGDDAKAFVAHHAACRAALAHLEQLLKIAKAMGTPPAETEEAAILVVEARTAIAQYEEEEQEQEEEDPDAAEDPC